jgi:sugar O-acyltransferase (sialic acid O-acetyltransferase NeuD family)
MQPLLLFGAGGHAKVILDALVRAGRSVDGVLDDDPASTGRLLAGLLVVGTRDVLTGKWSGAAVMPAIGNNTARAALLSWLKQHRHTIFSVAHPLAVIGNGVVVGEGSFLAAGAVVNSDTSLGEGAIVNTLASVDHDCRIGRCVHIAPGARLCGGVSVGEETLVGTGAVVIPGISIGARAVIGAGSVVIRDVPDGAKVAGNPARPL